MIPPFYGFNVLQTVGGISVTTGQLLNQFYWQGRTQEPVMRQVSLNLSSNLTHGLVFCAYPGGARWDDLVNGGRANLANSVSQWFSTGNWLRYGYGKGATSTDRTSYPWEENIATILDQCSIVVGLSVSSLSSTFAGLVSIPYANGTWVAPFVAMDFTRNSTTSSCNFDYASSGTLVTVTSDTGMIAADNINRLYGVTRDGATVTFFKDGFQHGAQKTLGTNTVTDWGAKQDPTIGNRSFSSPGNSMGGTFTFIGIWNRVLSPSEMTQLFLVPLILLTPTM